MQEMPLAEFERGIAVGREVAGRAVRRVAALAEENPGQMLLAGLCLGLLAGKLLLRRPAEPQRG